MTWPNTSLEPTGVGAGSSASRSTSPVAGGSVGSLAILRMKFLITITLLAVIVVLSGCARNYSNAPDGFYVGCTNNASGYTARSGNYFYHIQNSAFEPDRVVVAVSRQRSDWFDLVITGRAKEGMPDKYNGIVVIANRKVYYGISKRTGSSGTVKLVFETSNEVDIVASALRTHFSLPPVLWFNTTISD